MRGWYLNYSLVKILLPLRLAATNTRFRHCHWSLNRNRSRVCSICTHILAFFLVLPLLPSVPRLPTTREKLFTCASLPNPFNKHTPVCYCYCWELDYCDPSFWVFSMKFCLVCEKRKKVMDFCKIDKGITLDLEFKRTKIRLNDRNRRKCI